MSLDKRPRPTVFGQLVRDLRLQAGLSQEQLQSRSGVGYVSQIETGVRGRQPSRTTVLNLARALEVSPNPLLEAAGFAPIVVSDEPNPVIAEIRHDPALTAQAKEVLTSMYLLLVERGSFAAFDPTALEPQAEASRPTAATVP